MTKLNREDCAKIAANHYKITVPKPKKPLELPYDEIATAVLSDSATKIYQDIMIYAGLEWELYKIEDLEEHLSSRMSEWSFTP